MSAPGARPEARTLTVPCHLVWDKGRPVVGFAEIDARHLAMPFWHQTLNRRSRLIAVKPLDACADDSAPTRLIGMIHHMTRCGSTLAARQISAVPGVYALSEPMVFAQLLDAPHGAPDQRARWLRQLLALHVEALAPFAGRLAIKWPSLLSLCSREIAAALPGVPAIFLHRDPLEVLASIARSPLGGGAALRADHLPPDLRPPDFSAAAGNPLELDARYIGAVCRAIRESGAARLVAYPTLPAAAWERIAPYFGLALDQDARRAMEAASRFYSKAPGADKIFQDDSVGKRADAPPGAARLARDFIEPDLRAMLAAGKSL